MASDFEKPDKVHTLFPEEVPAKMWPLPVGDLFGVGPSAARRLNAWGVYTIGELAAMDRDTAVRLFGTRGDTLWNYANGREADPLTKQRARDNSYGNSVTMPKDLEKPEQADATMLALCDSVGRRLRRDGKTARVVTVQLVDNAFRRTSHQTTLPNPTNSTDRLYHVAVELMRQMWPAGRCGWWASAPKKPAPTTLSRWIYLPTPPGWTNRKSWTAPPMPCGKNLAAPW